MDGDAERVFERSLRWYVPILVVTFIVQYLAFFPIGQKAWMSPLRLSIEAGYALATIVYAALCIRAMRSRKRREQ